MPLGRQVLGVVDPDTSVEDLRFTLKVMPNHGQMEKILNNNRIFLRQGKGKPNFVVCAFFMPLLLYVGFFMILSTKTLTLAIVFELLVIGLSFFHMYIPFGKIFLLVANFFFTLLSSFWILTYF